jgi:hypothetical protein
MVLNKVKGIKNLISVYVNTTLGYNYTKFVKTLKNMQK